MEWFDVTDNKRFVPGGVNQEFKEGHVYKVTIHFRSKVGYEFVEEGVLMGTINGREAVVEYSTYGDFAGISYTFEALKHVHDMTRVNKVSPTCTKSGKETYYHCTSCNKYYEDAAGKTQIINLTSWGNIKANGHKPSELKSNSTHHFKVCTVCYTEIAGSKAAHSGGTATCITKAKCKDCGVSYGELAAHKLATDVWGFIDASGHAHLCLTQDCYYRDDVVPHRSSGAATEDADEVCLDCGYVISLAANHSHTALEGYQYDGRSHWKTCGCGEIMDKKEHINSNDDNRCDICGYMLSGEVTDSTDPTEGTVPGNEDVTTPPQADDGDKNNNSYVIWIVLAVSLALDAAAGVGFVVWNKKKK